MSSSSSSSSSKKRSRSPNENFSSGKSSGYYHGKAKKPKKSHSKQTGKRGSFARSKSKGEKQVTLESHLLHLLKEVFTKDPSHPMFGDPKKGFCVAPYIVKKADGSEHKGKLSWRKICKIIAGFAAKSDVVSLADAKSRCWMSKQSQISFNMSVDGSVSVMRKVLVVRVLSFLKTPTREKFDWLNSAELSTPFDHFCSRGQHREGQEGVCINGLTHGAESTRNDNEDRKKCTYGALALCPGHGPKKSKCIFTRPDGTLQPCRNNKDQVGPCFCVPSCF